MIFPMRVWVVFLAATLGCSPSVSVTYSHCPVPIMLSPIDRVGGQRSPSQETGSLDVLEESSSFTQITSQSTAGNVTYVHTSTTITGPMTLTLEALRLVSNRADVEASSIQLDGVRAGAFVGPGYTKIWGTPVGRKVWVK